MLEFLVLKAVGLTVSYGVGKIATALREDCDPLTQKVVVKAAKVASSAVLFTDPTGLLEIGYDPATDAFLS